MNSNAEKAYKEISLATDVANAAGVGLIVLVYERIISHLLVAQRLVESGQDSKAETTKAFMLVRDGLIAALNNDGGSISTNLLNLYRWALRQILLGQALGDVSRINAVISSMTIVLSAWRILADQERFASLT